MLYEIKRRCANDKCRSIDKECECFYGKVKICRICHKDAKKGEFNGNICDLCVHLQSIEWRRRTGRKNGKSL